MGDLAAKAHHRKLRGSVYSEWLVGKKGMDPQSDFLMLPDHIKPPIPSFIPY